MIDTREKKAVVGTYYPPQVKAANEIMDNFFAQWVTTVVLSAECQSGKTGALQALLDMTYSLGTTLHVFTIVPSNTPLREQTEKRLFQSAKARLRHVQRRVHHAADIYRAGTKREALVAEIQAVLSLGEHVLVVWDEAHIGAGTTREKNKTTQEVDVEWQKIPALFDELFGGIPGCAAAAGVRYLAITATPFDWDHYIDGNPGCDTAEVILDGGPGYVGLRELKNQGRLLPHIKRNKVKFHLKEQEDADFKKRLQALMIHLSLQEIPKYLVFRCTTANERRWFEYAAQAAGLPYREFVSSAGTIGDFEDTLRTAPTQTQALMIVQSFKEGQTICHDHIGAWYECDTKSGRNHADIYQSVGRNMGYFDPENVPTYPIYMDTEVADILTDYIDAMHMRDFAGKRTFPLTSTHKKVKCTEKPERICVSYNSRQEAEKDYTTRCGPNMGKFVVEYTSKNKHDMIGNLQKGTRRRSTRVNIHYCDGPSHNPAHQASWNNNPQWHGKYIIQYDTGRTQRDVQVKSTSMHIKTD
tara:strand:+ start:1342 stop:2922 length:1581 start_codon:yes stop_codon:yes gene_type:complete